MGNLPWGLQMTIRSKYLTNSSFQRRGKKTLSDPDPIQAIWSSVKAGQAARTKLPIAFNGRIDDTFKIEMP